MVKRSPEGRVRRATRIKARVSSPSSLRFSKCAILGCGKPTGGVAIALCRKHLQHRQRHGSPFCKSPSAKLLNPYLKAALAFIKLHHKDPYISNSLASLRDLAASAGEVTPATRLRGLSPRQRSKIALARLREAKVKPERLLAITLAVHALIKLEPVKTHRIKEWRIVAIAKAAHRLASGDHRIWEARDGGGRIVLRTEMHTYPRSSGRVLRYMGEAIERESDWVIEQHLKDVIARIANSKPFTTSH